MNNCYRKLEDWLPLFLELDVQPFSNVDYLEPLAPDLFVPDNIFVYWEYFYSSRLVMVPGEPNLAGAQKMTNIINAYCETCRFRFKRTVAALLKEYDPLTNYDMKERSLDVFNGSDEVTTTDKNKLTTTEKSSTYDSTSLRDVGSTESEYEKDNVSTMSHKHDQTGKYTGSTNDMPDFGTDNETVSKHYLDRKGNIGVTTTQKLLQEEIELVKINILKEFFEYVNKIVLLNVWEV